MCRRLRKMLFGIKTIKGKESVLIDLFYQSVILLLLLIVTCVDTHKTVKEHLGCRNSKEMLARGNFYRCRLIFGRRHPARHKAFPDQLIQAELIPAERFF